MSTPDRTSGSMDVAHGFLERLERFAATDMSPNPTALRARLLGWLRAEQAGQPSMALIHQLSARALDVAATSVTRGDSIAEARANLASSCAAEHDDLEAARKAAAQTAERLVSQPGAWIATLSHSRAVIDALTLVQRDGHAPRALVAEGRPLLEGRHAAAELGAAGVPAWIVADAALPMLVSQASMVWIGADAITERGVINKVGSYAVALAAREHSVPVYALAMRRKFLPSNTGALQILEMPPAEVWDAPAPGVEPRNVYFELVPLPLLRGIVVEDAVLGVTEAAQLARERALPEELRGA